MVKMKVPKIIEQICKRLCQANFHAYIVGGAVRDFLLGKSPHDFDIATDAPIDILANLFSEYKIIETGLKHGTVMLHANHENIEITIFRGEKNDIRADLLLRDFTMNSLAYDPLSQNYENIEALKDIKDRIIRINGDDDSRFLEDPLRILRAIRFKSILKFTIEEKTKKYIMQNKDLLKRVSMERINDEFNMILLSDKAAEIINEYFEVFLQFIPELEAMQGFAQNNPHHFEDCLQHTLRVLNSTKPNLTIRLAALFHDIAKPRTYTVDENGIGHFYGHPQSGAEISKVILRRLRYDSDTIHNVSLLIQYHDFPLDSKKALKKVLNMLGDKLIFALLELKDADQSAHVVNENNKFRSKDNLIQEINDIIDQQECFMLSKLAVNGEDLISLGIKPGKKIGELLNYLLEKVISGEIENTKEALVNAIPENSF